MIKMDINDVIYGQFSIPSDVAAIVKTEQFERLKSVKQLGFMKIGDHIEHEHHRYAHCLGTYYAAKLMLDALEENTQRLRDNNNKIPLVYRNAVQLAALLHDIGHGPFSHTWEHVVNNYVHETESITCVDHIFEKINAELFPELRENNNFGIELIKALIDGSMDNFKFKSELPRDFHFIFEIVSNKRSKLDVDKWDYLKRDYYYLQNVCKPNMDFDDVFLKARVSDCGTAIEYRYEDYDKIYNLFAARYQFHVNCYSLPEYNVLCDHILRLAVQEVEPEIDHILVTQIRAHNMQEFLKLTDKHILELVKTSYLRNFLEHETRFQQVDEISETTLSASVNIKNVLQYMPDEEKLCFYGDEKNKSPICDQTNFISRTYKAYCDPSTQTVYYTVQHE